MIKSILFPKEGSGYLYEKYEKPEKVDANSKFTRKGDMDWYKQALADYKKYGNTYKRPLAAGLIGKKIEFRSDKVNVLFGRNASGKTTIINSLSAIANVSDGWSSFIEPFALSKVKRLGDMKYTVSDIKRYFAKMQKNTCKVDWDGAPIYRHNVGSGAGSLGSLVGGAIASFGDEIWWRANKQSMSSMQGEMFLLNEVFSYMQTKVKFTNVFAKIAHEREHGNWNSTWKGVFDSQMKYYLQLEKFDDDSLCNTYLFDEFDKHLDITNVVALYTEALPVAVEKTHPQVITVSHSPIVLSRAVEDTGMYNIISLDDEYTDRCKEMLKKIF